MKTFIRRNWLRMVVLRIILAIVLMFYVLAPQATASELTAVETNISPDHTIVHMASDIQQMLKRNLTSYQVLLRELSLIVGPRFINRPWTTVSQELGHQGYQVVDEWENGCAINSHYLIETNVFVTPSGYPLDLYLMMLAENLDYAKTTQRPGQVFQADATFVSNVHLPFSKLVAQGRFPKGSIMDKVLALQEVKDAGAMWPLVKRIYASYGLLYNRWVEYNPSGFTVTVEFEIDPMSDIGMKDVTYMFQSGLDPLKTKDGVPEISVFTPKDSLVEVTILGEGESWHGDDKTIEKAKAKYLKKASTKPGRRD